VAQALLPAGPALLPVRRAQLAYFSVHKVHKDFHGHGRAADTSDTFSKMPPLKTHNLPEIGFVPQIRGIPFPARSPIFFRCTKCTKVPKTMMSHHSKQMTYRQLASFRANRRAGTRACRVPTPGDAPRASTRSGTLATSCASPTLRCESDKIRHFPTLFSCFGFAPSVCGFRHSCRSGRSPIFSRCTKCTNCPVRLRCNRAPSTLATSAASPHLRLKSDKIRHFPTLFPFFGLWSALASGIPAGPAARLFFPTHKVHKSPTSPPRQTRRKSDEIRHFPTLFQNTAGRPRQRRSVG